MRRWMATLPLCSASAYCRTGAQENGQGPSQHRKNLQYPATLFADIDIIVTQTEVIPTLITASNCIPNPKGSPRAEEVSLISYLFFRYADSCRKSRLAGLKLTVPMQGLASAPRGAASHILRFDVMFFKLFSNTGPPIMHSRSIIRVYYNPTSGMFGLFSCFIIFCWYFKNVNKHNFIAINVDHP